MDADALALTDDQIQALLNGDDTAERKAYVRLRALLGIVALAGQTPGQALSVLREDVRLDSNPPQIDVRQAYHEGDDDIPRSITIGSPSCSSALGEYLRDHLQEASHRTGGAPLFEGPGGKRLTTRWAQRELEALRQKLGLSPIRLRDLRRAAIQRMLGKGIPPPEIAEHLGLRDVTFTRSLYPSTHRRRRISPARPKQPVGRPRKKMERDAELVRMRQQPGATVGTVTRDYNKRNPGDELETQTVKRAIKRHLEFLAREAKS